MATLRATLTLNSASVLASPVNVSADFSAAADSGILSRAKVLKTAVDANALEVYTANDKTESAYVFLTKLTNDVVTLFVSKKFRPRKRTLRLCI